MLACISFQNQVCKRLTEYCELKRFKLFYKLAFGYHSVISIYIQLLPPTSRPWLKNINSKQLDRGFKAYSTSSGKDLKWVKKWQLNKKKFKSCYERMLFLKIYIFSLLMLVHSPSLHSGITITLKKCVKLKFITWASFGVHENHLFSTQLAQGVTK